MHQQPPLSAIPSRDALDPFHLFLLFHLIHILCILYVGHMEILISPLRVGTSATDQCARSGEDSMAMEQKELLLTPEEGVQMETENLERSMTQLRDELQLIQGGKERRPSAPKLLLPDGKQVELPPNVFQALRFVVHHMAHGDAISLMPMDKLLTTRQSADILSVSRPFLTGLLRQGDIPCIMVGTHRRVKMQDIIHYKKRRDEQALRMLDELAVDAQTAGDYFG